MFSVYESNVFGKFMITFDSYIPNILIFSIKNPEFAFLFGGESGSEAAIAHEYFLWMKKKCVLEYQIPEG